MKNDFDIWQEAIDSMDLTEAVAPVVRGVTLLEDTQVEMYNKIQKLLNTDGMESSHPFLYQLDPLELSEDECDKVNKLYQLGQARGLIVDEPVAADEPATDVEVAVEPEQKPLPLPPPVIPIRQSAFTVLYSATRNGEIKNGEAFSNCIDVRSAKADVIGKLDRAGYQNIQILAIEAGDPDAAGYEPQHNSADDTDVPDYSVEEADDREPLSHALDPVRVKASTASLADQDAVAISEVTPTKKQQEIVSEEDDKEDEEKGAAASDDAEKDDGKEPEVDEEKDDEETKDDADGDEEEDDVATDDADAEELTAEQKEELKNSYTKAFKDTMKKCKFATSFSELSLDQKVQFFTELAKVWGDKADPSKFMTDKETDQLEKIVFKA